LIKHYANLILAQMQKFFGKRKIKTILSRTFIPPSLLYHQFNFLQGKMSHQARVLILDQPIKGTPSNLGRFHQGFVT
jgi:hypothetical protein